VCKFPPPVGEKRKEHLEWLGVHQDNLVAQDEPQLSVGGMLEKNILGPVLGIA
jgi:hypothetical protein